MGLGFMQSWLPTSTAVWKMAGVVSEEKVMVLAVKSSVGKLPRNWLMIDVLAVPGPPTSRDACPHGHPTQATQPQAMQMPPHATCSVLASRG